MGISQEKYILFNAYLRNELNEEERKNFEQKLGLDKEFLKDFKEFALISNEIEIKGELDFIENLKEIDKKIPEPVLIGNQRRWILSIAASLIIVIGISIVIYMNRGINTDKIYLSYYQHYKNDLVEYARGEEVKSTIENISDEDYIILTEAMRYYDKRDYNKAIEIIEDVLAINYPHPGIVFFLAVSQMEVGRIEEAIENLEFLIDDPTHEYYEQAKWYLSLAYIKNNRIEKAKLLLKDLEYRSKKYKNQATELLKKIK